MLHQIPKRKIKLCGGLNFVVATWLLVKPQVALKLNLRWSEYFAIIGGNCHKYLLLFLSRQIRQICLSRQKCLSRQNTSFIATKLCLSRQNYICPILLSRQKTCLIQVAAAANDTLLGCCRTTLSSGSEGLFGDVIKRTADRKHLFSVVISQP